MPNGLFWTMAIPDEDFEVSNRGKKARLHSHNLPVPDTFFYANNVSVAAEISANVTWRSSGPPQKRGKGSSVPPSDFAAFEGDFRDARASGFAAGAETGFHFKSAKMDSSGFYASIGPQKNGVYLT